MTRTITQYDASKNPRSIRYALTQKGHVMQAVILRDVRTRFFNHGLGFLLVPLWPLAHMFILLLIYTFMGRKAPFGDSLRLFFATGLLPCLTFMYVSRFMALSIVMNRPMLAIPAVKVLDILFARAFLEIIGAFMTVLLTFLILLALGDNPFPHDWEQAALAFLSTILLAIGMGVLAGVITSLFAFFATVYALSLILVYIMSGTLFVVAALPAQVAYALSWNPVMHSVEWMRSAFYPSYSSPVLDKYYLLSFGLGALCSGLVLERIVRRIALEGK
ncbi:ABC transporter permease [Rhizobiaceae bacterium BDR2-2]|uniref:ABC transporter permease n=1 Tax=Ectorhizobium quercum TaxID=2965071 RepID=A0AAE3N307_9HYPH|nr:ABC transporter permease [Ectorhizobium quercum]MCX8996202.1 ABC transporter permease [Ectorhizobium quercum]MCX8998759.1 ABC transporter permease [Ectorhizobium quercum]